jgi:hypothetical protein
MFDFFIKAPILFVEIVMFMLVFLYFFFYKKVSFYDHIKSVIRVAIQLPIVCIFFIALMYTFYNYLFENDITIIYNYLDDLSYILFAQFLISIESIGNVGKKMLNDTQKKIIAG